MKKRYSQRGFILITVVLTVTLLCALLLGFAQQSRSKLQAADNYHARRQAWHCAQAGVNITRALIEQNSDNFNNPTLAKMLQHNLEFKVADGNVTVIIEDEQGKINVNQLKNSQGQINRKMVDRLLRLFDLLNQKYDRSEKISYSLAPCIIDWIDEDNQTTVLPFVSHDNRGAESEYYQKLTNSYRCSNQPLESLDELMLIKQMKPGWLYHNDNHDNNQPPSLAQCLTVYGSGKINLNTAPALVIQSLSENITPALARDIIERRKLKPFTGIDELMSLPGMITLAQDRIVELTCFDTPEHYYKIIATGKYRNCAKTITVIVHIKTLRQQMKTIFYQEF